MALADTGKVERAKFVLVGIARSPERFTGFILNAKAPSAGNRIEAYERFRVEVRLEPSALSLSEAPGNVSPVIAPFLVVWEL